MTSADVDRFFRVLSTHLHEPAQVIVTGAAAAALWGAARSSLDVDFAITLVREGEEGWDRVEEAVAKTTALTTLAANYSEDIDRWGAVTLMDYRRHTTRYRRFGTVDVRLLEPAYWSIGKVTRYLESDIRDMIAVFTSRRVPAARVIRVWARAIRASPRSAALSLVCRQAEHFLTTHGRAVWGDRFDPQMAVKQFRRALRSSGQGGEAMKDRWWGVVGGMVVGGVMLAGRGAAQEGTMSTVGVSQAVWKVTSGAFQPGGTIPSRYTCDGEDVSPPLGWGEPPAGTKSFALISDDPDAPMGTWVHWVVYNLPPATRQLPEGFLRDEQLPDGTRQGRTDFGRTGYGGPCPPSGTHRYFFKLYALDTMLALKPGATAKELEAAMQGHVLAGAELMGTYRRAGY